MATEAGDCQGALTEEGRGAGLEASGAGMAAVAEGVQRGCTAVAARSAPPACPPDGLAVSREAGPLATDPAAAGLEECATDDDGRADDPIAEAACGGFTDEG